VVNVLGLDIGGANTKAAFVATSKGVVTELEVRLEYFPFWKRDTSQLCTMLAMLQKRVCKDEPLDCVAITITAELSDAYRTKREGIHHILDCVARVFAPVTMRVLGSDVALHSVEVARAEPLLVAAANWAATGWMVAQKLSDCVVVDVGSTSTSIIPIVGGKVVAEGKTDLEKLMNGELVYTGSLRTNVAAIVNSVPLRGEVARVSSELFAQSGDIHLLLSNITEADYTAETADGKGKISSDAAPRLADVVCADTDMLTQNEIIQIAKYIYSQQVLQISEALNQVYARIAPNSKATPVVVTGLGRQFLGRKAAEALCLENILDLQELFADAALASPAVGVAFMAATELEGASLTWMR
jgi:probable H4MPT-linked C1 transfer pathway protein